MSNIQLSGLAKRLVSDGVLDEATAASATKAAKRENQSFAQHAVEAKLVKSRELAGIAAQAFGSPLFDLGSYNFDLIPKGLIDEKLISKHFALPLYKRGNRLFVAVADPTNLAGLDEINFNTGLNTDAVLVEAETGHLDSVRVDQSVDHRLPFQSHQSQEEACPKPPVVVRVASATRPAPGSPWLLPLL